MITHWTNFYVNRAQNISMLAEDPHTTQKAALEHIDDYDGHPDPHGTEWTYMYSICMKNGKAQVINMTALVKEMNEQSRLDRRHERETGHVLRTLQ